MLLNFRIFVSGNLTEPCQAMHCTSTQKRATLYRLGTTEREKINKPKQTMARKCERVYDDIATQHTYLN